VAGLFDEQTSITEQDTMLLIATLFALNPAKVDAPWQQDLGAVLREVGQKRGGDEGVKAVERRFLALLGASPDELPTFLRHAISLAATEEVPISWQRLYQDVLKLMKNYEDARQDVIRKWSRSFWKKAAATEKSNDETTSDSEN
jgi:CRISPR type I-E-associated protein CasB/Cse2